MNSCQQCGINEAKIITKIKESSMTLCTNCYNQLKSKNLKVNLEQFVETFSMKDFQGVSRTFNVGSRLNSLGIYIEASENIELGYKFAVYGDLQCNQQALFNKLIDKVRKGIKEQHLEERAFPGGQLYTSILNDQFTGLIEYDETSEGLPLVIIDGKPFTWEEVGKMVMSYEGFQIKVNMFDITDDVE